QQLPASARFGVLAWFYATARNLVHYFFGTMTELTCYYHLFVLGKCNHRCRLLALAQKCGNSELFVLAGHFERLNYHVSVIDFGYNSRFDTFPGLYRHMPSLLDSY